jgi:xanthine dehydrogenase accessory factor
MPSIILIRGGGDLATGVAIRLIRCGLRIAVTELPEPFCVRRSVSFAEAVFTGEITVEGITARCVEDPTDSLRTLSIFARQQVPVLVDPGCLSAGSLHPSVIVDARMVKHPPDPIGYAPELYIGLGPGFVAGVNCQAVVETRRSHTLGRVFFQGSPDPDTGQPDGNPERVLRAPVDGLLSAHARIGDHLEQGHIIAEIENATNDSGKPGTCLVKSPFRGILRGLIHSGLMVTRGLKIGDVDPRDDPQLCELVSEKALAIGGGVLEAILSQPAVRAQLWS